MPNDDKQNNLCNIMSIYKKIRTCSNKKGLFSHNDINIIIGEIDKIPMVVIKLALITDHEKMTENFLNSVKNSEKNDTTVITALMSVINIKLCDRFEFEYFCNKYGCSCIENEYVYYIYDKLKMEIMKTIDKNIIQRLTSNLAILLNATSIYTDDLFDLSKKILQCNIDDYATLLIVGKLYSERYFSLLDTNAIDKNIKKHLSRININFSKIHDHIYLSGKQCAENGSLLIDNNIKNMLSLVKIEKKFKNINYDSMYIDDISSQELKEALKFSMDIISKSVNKKENILCHCNQGISRSPAIVIGYMMKKHNMSYDDAYNYVKSKHIYTNMNEGFKKQLSEMKTS